MGQQQLLLIVLGVIIVGIAVVVGINVFTASASQANKDAVVADLTNIAAMAQQFYRKPAALGGGGNTFTGFAVPTSLSPTANMTGIVTLTPGAQSITLAASGTEKGADGTNAFTVTMIVGPNAITSTAFTN